MRVGGGRIELLAALGPGHAGRQVPRQARARDAPRRLRGRRRRRRARAARRPTGAELIDERPRPGIFGLEVGFVHPHATGGVLAELVSGG